MKKITYLFIAAIIVVSGCKKLDEVPQSSLSPKNYYTNIAQVEAAFAASMNPLWNYWTTYGQGYQTSYIFSNDDQVYAGELDVDVYIGEDVWGHHYKAIANLNAVLNALLTGKTIATKEELDILEGQARFLRGYNYFMLVRLFGGVPLYTEGENAGTNPEARASIEDVYALIVNDLKIASEKLPTSWPTTQQGRPNRYSASGMLAKVYLTMATAPLNKIDNYALAAAEALKVINSGIELIPEIENVFAMDHRYNPEWLFSFNSTYDDKSTPVDQYSPPEEPWEGWADVSAADTFALHFPDQPRKFAYLQCYNEDGVYYTEWEVGGKRPGIRKYMYSDIKDIWNYKTWYNFPVLRYADVLLIYAEAANMASGSPTQAAVDAINQVIDRANGETGTEERASTSMSKDQFNKKVIQERSYELCYEYDRWFDLLRTRTLKQALQASKPLAATNFDEKYYLLPIPPVDLRLNPLLKPNNPGWPDTE